MKTASWNIEGRLSRFAEAGRRGSPESIVGAIQVLDSDVLFLPEAFDGSKRVEPEIMQRLEQDLGYTIFSAQYNDSGHRRFAVSHDPHMMLLTRVGIRHVEEQRLGDVRCAVIADVENEDSSESFRIIGVHLDDREESSRLKQVKDLLPFILHSPTPVVVMGDFNALWKESTPARLLRSGIAQTMAGLVFRLSRYGGEGGEKINDMLQRLSQMAIGSTLHQIVTETDLAPADHKGRLTMTPKMRGQEWLPSIRLVQIDHMLVSPSIRATDFLVSRDGGSDHRAISTVLSLCELDKSS